MSKTQDVFGASPKSVLNKPMMHVQQSYPSGTAAPAHTVGQNVRALNTVKTNEIIGAALSSSQVALPAGEYYIDAECHICSLQVANATVQTQLQKADKTILLSGSVANQSTNTNVAGTATSRVTGRITLTETTALELNGHGITSSSGLQYNVGNTGQPEIGADLRIWKLDSNVETPVIADPSMTLARPLMHVRDQKPQGTAGGTSVAGLNDRVLNTVLTNEIPGASLASNEVTLPAGEYFIAAYMNAHFTSTLATSAQGLLRKSDDTVILFGPGVGAYNVTQEGWHRLSGRFTLTESTAVKLTTDCKGAYAEYGLGNPSNLGQDEIYTDVQIWQLDAVNKQPILVNDRLYPLPGNVIVTGNMHGLEYAYTSPSLITVQPGICMDSLNETPLTLTNQQVVTIPSTPSTIFNLFLTDDGQQVKVDTDVNGVNLGTDKRRWIGFVLNDASGNIIEFIQRGDRFTFNISQTVYMGTATAYTSVSITAFVPSTRLSGVIFNITVSGSTTEGFISLNGTSAHEGLSVGSTSPRTSSELPALDTYYFASGSGAVTSYLQIASVRLKR